MDNPMIELAAALLLWIGINSSYDTMNMDPPDIFEIAPLQITAAAYIDNPEMIPEGRVDSRIFA